MKINVALITGNELRHKYFASFISTYPNINLKLVVHESNVKLKKNLLYNKIKIVKNHIDARQKSEIFFFRNFVKKNKKYKSINIKQGKANSKKIFQKIKDKKIDFIISYGCSIIKEEFINQFKPNFLNIHLGLSPYYKGAGTNFFPFVNNELHFCGSTIMQLDKKLDSGKIIHQIRPKFKIKDDIHSVGNRIIKQTVKDLCKILTVKKKIKFFKIKSKFKSMIYKKSDFDHKKLKIALDNLSNGQVLNYISKSKKKMEKKYPIISQI